MWWENPAFWTFLGIVFGGMITGFWTYIASRKKAAAVLADSNTAMAVVVHKGFQSLIDELHKEHAADQQEVAELREEVARLMTKVGDLSNYVQELFAYLRAHNLDEGAPRLRPGPGAVEIG